MLSIMSLFYGAISPILAPHCWQMFLYTNQISDEKLSLCTVSRLLMMKLKQVRGMKIIFSFKYMMGYSKTKTDVNFMNVCKCAMLIIMH